MLKIKKSDRKRLIRLIDEYRDQAGESRRQEIAGILEKHLPGTDIVNLSGSDLPAEDILESCIRHEETVAKLNRNQLLELVVKIMKGSSKSEVDDNLLIHLFMNNCKHPAGTDLIFYPDEVFGAGIEPTPEMVVEKAFSDS